MSISWLRDARPAPAILVLPPAAVSLDEAHAAVELWEFYKRRTLDPAQRLAVEVMMATASGGLWAAATTGREMPRQNGKGDEIEVVELWGLVQRAERILHTIHDAVLLATETQSRMLSLIEGHADLRRLKERAWRGTGQQMIEMRNGGIIWYRTRTGGGARGVDEVDRIVVDEAQHAEDEHLAALTPTQLASTNPQLNAMGSAAIAGKSGWWWRLRKRAIGTDPGNLGYVGHSAETVSLDPEGRVIRSSVDASDRKLWRRANPALAAGRVAESFFEEQFRRLGPDLFGREHLGVWDPDVEDESSVVAADLWESMLDPSSSIVSRECLAFDISPDRKWSAFGAAGRRADGLVHLEVVDRRPGTDWVLGRAKELAAKYGELRVQSGTPAAAMLSKLIESGVEVVEVSKAEHAQAVGQFLDDAKAGALRHLGQASLDAALRAAVLQVSGDVDVWGRRTSRADVCALVAVTLALGGVPSITAGRPVFAW